MPVAGASIGTPQAGRLLDGAALPFRGEGFRFETLRGNPDARWGTVALVGAIHEAIEVVGRRHPGGMLVVQDMSQRDGGTLQGHLSHTSGRDADLRLYGVDDTGRPIALRNVEYGADGRARDGGPERLDLARNWALVEALVTTRRARVQFLFLHESLERLLVTYGREHAPRAVVARAARVLQPAGDPRRTAPHDDHFHLRIACGPVDRAMGCADRARRGARPAPTTGKDAVSRSRRRAAGRTSPG